MFSTVDTVGIPLALLGRLGRVRPAIVYAAIGLPERLAQLRGAAAKRVFVGAFRRMRAIVAYGWGEVDELRSWLGYEETTRRVRAVRCGREFFRPERDVAFDDDVDLDRSGSSA